MAIDRRMRRPLAGWRLLAFTLGAVLMYGQPPAIAPRGILNAASRIPQSAAAGSIARGSRFEITGVRLGTRPSDVIVSLTQHQTKLIAPLVSVAYTRIEALMPTNAPLGELEITVTRGGETSMPGRINVVASSFGIFTENRIGWGPARVIASPSGVKISFANPARPGQLLAISGTGLGSDSHPAVIVAGRPADVVRVDRKDQGVDEIAFRLPIETPEGCFVPFYVRASAAQGPASARWVTNQVVVPVAKSGPCKPASYWPLPPTDPGRTFGLLAFSREYTPLSPSEAALAPPGFEMVREHGAGGFFAATGAGPLITTAHMLPPPGTCLGAARYLNADIMGSGLSPLLDLSDDYAQPRNGDTFLTLRRPNAERLVPARTGAAGVYSGPIGSTGGEHLAESLFLDPGEFTITSAGGREIGPFSATVRALPDFSWPQRERLGRIDRKAGVELQWTDPVRDRVMLILAVSVDRETGAAGQCLCVAPRSARRFVLGPDALANFPVSSRNLETRRSFINLLAIDGNPPVALKASGLDSGFAVTTVIRIARVDFR